MSSHSPDSGVSRPVHPLYTEYALDECEYVPDLCQTSDEIVAMDDPERLQACFARHSGWGSGRLAVVRGLAVGFRGYMCGRGWGVPKIALWIITYSERVIFLLQIELPLRG